MIRQIVLDTETTGLHLQEGHRIIEIGCIELVNRKITPNHFHYYLNPDRSIDEGAAAVHGITSDFLSDKPRFIDIAASFIGFIDGAELIIHNAPFDVGFIENELALTQKNWKPLVEYCQIFDTLRLARQLHTGQRNSLDALCKRYQVDNTQREFHGALLDAHLLAQVYLAMTGGQGSLFDDLKTTEKQQGSSTGSVDIAESKPARKLFVLRANQEEQAAHESYLKEMSEK